jgi:glycosyltransferase involved in cell wall biosynthesis
LAKLLDPSRYEQRVMVRGAVGSISAELERNGVPVITIGEGSLFSRGALYAAISLARAFRPHIVHGAVFEGLPPAVVAGRACGARVIVEETSHATNRSRAGHLLFRSLVAASDACVAISPGVGEYLRDVTRVPLRKIHVIPNGVFRPILPSLTQRPGLRLQLGFAPDDFVVGSVSRLVDDGHKRVSDLIRAVANASASCPRVRLLVAGDGRERLGLERLARTLGLAEKAVFTGHREDVGNLYRVMDVFALVSGREGFGLVLPEAMFCGLPVIATRVGGIPDIVISGETGLLVPPCDPRAIADAILRLEAEPQVRARMGEAALRRAELKFSAERYAKDVDAFYQALLARRFRPATLWSRWSRVFAP